MKKLGPLVKEITEKQVTARLRESGAVFVINYDKLSSPDITSLRQLLKNIESRMFVVKNSVARRALKGNGMDALVTHIDGPCGMIFAKDDPVSMSKVLSQFSKDHEKMRLCAGLYQQKILEKKDIEVMAGLPSRDMLRAKAVMVLNAPIRGFVVVLNQTLVKLVYCLDQIKRKKESGS